MTVALVDKRHRLLLPVFEVSVNGVIPDALFCVRPLSLPVTTAKASHVAACRKLIVFIAVAYFTVTWSVDLFYLSLSSGFLVVISLWF